MNAATLETVSARLRPSWHARDVMARRAISWPEIVEIVADPAVVEPHEDRTRYTRGDLVAVVAEDGPDLVLVTVLLRSRETWTDSTCRSRRLR